MELTKVTGEIAEFCRETHGSSDYHKEELFVQGKKLGEYAPLKYLGKKLESPQNVNDLLEAGFTFSAYDLFEDAPFKEWFEKQFSRKLSRTHAKTISIVSLPNNKEIFDAVETVNKCYQILRDQHILLNSKNLPVQLGEWYAKCIFGLHQKKSASQRGFDFYLENKRVEVKVDWGEFPSPKGVKVRKSLVELSDYCVIIYVAQNLMIREVCVLDSDFVSRKFSSKGHTIFLKDSDVGSYFFSRSQKHMNKVVNSNALLKFASPTLAIKLAEFF